MTSAEGRALGQRDDFRLVEVLDVNAEQPLPLGRVGCGGEDAQAATAEQPERLALQGSPGACSGEEGEHRTPLFGRGMVEHAGMPAADLVQRAAGREEADQAAR